MERHHSKPKPILSSSISINNTNSDNNYHNL